MENIWGDQFPEGLALLAPSGYFRAHGRILGSLSLGRVDSVPPAKGYSTYSASEKGLT